MLSKARGATAWNTFTCTGEGGYPERLMPYDDHVITQVATGLFGVREETIQRAPIVEFKYAQGAKPGLGGHLLGDKNTPAVAAMREAVAGNVAVLAVPVPQRLLGRGPQEAPRLDQARQPAGAGLGEGLDARPTWTWWPWAVYYAGRAHRPPRRQLRRHRRRSRHRQEEHRHADRVRHPQGRTSSWWTRASATRSR